MKKVLFAFVLFIVAACASKVLVRKDSCEPITSQFYVCEEAE